MYIELSPLLMQVNQIMLRQIVQFRIVKTKECQTRKLDVIILNAVLSEIVLNNGNVV